MYSYGELLKTLYTLTNVLNQPINSVYEVRYEHVKFMIKFYNEEQEYIANKRNQNNIPV